MDRQYVVGDLGQEVGDLEGYDLDACLVYVQDCGGEIVVLHGYYGAVCVAVSEVLCLEDYVDCDGDKDVVEELYEVEGDQVEIEWVASGVIV